MNTATKQKITKEFLQEWLSDQLAELLEIDASEVDVSKSFMDYGLSSLSLVGLEGDIEDLLETELDPTLLWDYPNIELISEYLGSNI